ncbi:radical SAM protein [Pseudodesulfovibrio sp. F-1]|uniref:Radical SAM protein n=1 Tax=Pseudodesulfovibrio alkaliphilus TaxID=2661613 RepID=A0A7K1KL10_9BACT|nr:radical SAM (seleno)protein TrsS [Pseudodesulfovibrio alkaliphilus]MUM76755.1 radical SAM protein [Pseudodesulfovibrio alkaliphilus]
MTREPRSVCPICLAPIPAWHETLENDTGGSDTYLIKECPEHGSFRTMVWRGPPDFADWSRPKIPSQPKAPSTPVDKGCPLDCGLCAAHRQHTCTAVLDVTARCNLGCPVCFASSGADALPDLSPTVIGSLLDSIAKASGFCNIQFSGGEPTTRDDLPDLIRLARRKGFSFIQLNTNGLRIGSEPGYAAALARAGLDSVFFQFDGMDNDIYTALRGSPLLERKLAAIDSLAQAGIGVVLVPTVVPGVNDRALGAIIRFAAANSPAVRGVHFQPISYFGRFPRSPADEQRITLPEVMRQLQAQTDGALQVSDFLAPGCEHSHCSFHANYIVTGNGGLARLSAKSACCAPPEPSRPHPTSPRPASEGADKAKAFVRRQWSSPDMGQPSAQAGDDFDRFIARASTHTLAVSAMAFQDCWTMDLERLKGCCIHAVSPDGRLIPFCAYNLTSMDGTTLYRGKCRGPAAP